MSLSQSVRNIPSRASGRNTYSAQTANPASLHRSRLRRHTCVSALAARSTSTFEITSLSACVAFDIERILLENHIRALRDFNHVLDFGCGCGCGRVIRWLPTEMRATDATSNPKPSPGARSTCGAISFVVTLGRPFHSPMRGSTSSMQFPCSRSYQRTSCRWPRSRPADRR